MHETRERYVGKLINCPERKLMTSFNSNHQKSGSGLFLFRRFSVLCVFCAFHSAAAWSQVFRRSQGTKRETLGRSEEGGPHVRAQATRRAIKGWWSHKSTRNWFVRPLETVIHRLQWRCVGWVRVGRGRLCLHRGAVVTLQRRHRSHSRCCSNPSTQTAPCSRQHSSPVISTYGRRMAALLSQPNPGVRAAGSLVWRKHHRHLAEMKGRAPRCVLHSFGTISNCFPRWGASPVAVRDNCAAWYSGWEATSATAMLAQATSKPRF